MKNLDELIIEKENELNKLKKLKSERDNELIRRQREEMYHNFNNHKWWTNGKQNTFSIKCPDGYIEGKTEEEEWIFMTCLKN